MFSDPLKNLEQFDMMPGMNVADFGSGSGHVALNAAAMVGPSGHVYAIDVQKEVLASLAREARLAHMRQVTTVCADLEKPGSSHLATSIIDRALVINVLFQLAEKTVLLKEIHRVLRPHGLVMVIDWQDARVGIHQDALFVPEAARALFEKNGFAFDRFINAGSHHYGMIFKKV